MSNLATPLPAPPPLAAEAWPTEVRRRTAERADAVRAGLGGRVLDMGDAAGRAAVAALLAGGPADERYDVVLSPGALPAFADLPAAAAALRSFLAPGGRLVLIEPVGRPGWTGLIVGTLSTVAAGGPALRGQHLNRDVPAAVRATGLTICAIERFTMTTSTWALRPFVEAVAAEIVPSTNRPARRVVGATVAEDRS